VSESFHGDAPPPTQRDDAIQPAQGREDPHVLADKSATSPPDMLAHRWGRKALREALLFLLVAAVVLVICGLVLPVPGEVFWLLVLIVAGIGAAIGAGFYLFNVVPRLMRAMIVHCYSSMPRIRRLKWQQGAFGLGFKIPFITSLVLMIIVPALWKWRRDTIFLLIMIPAMGLFVGLGTGVLWYVLVRFWNKLIDDTLARFSLTRPPQGLPDDYAGTISKRPDSDPELEPPPFADTDIISSRAPARRNAAPTDIQPGEPQP
jgi:MFS family permease